MDILEIIDELNSTKRLRPHYKLAAWQYSVRLVKSIYELSGQFPREEQFGLTSQIRSAATSSSLNIAEGTGRRTNKDKLRFFNIADGSLSEVETCLILALELDMINKEDFTFNLDLCRKVSAPLFGLMTRLKELNK
ncbi:MAG: four helix bundle protein [Flavobacteriales bacterium]|nr:four helix bundle protein [Flavobacteriales bacterium]